MVHRSAGFKLYQEGAYDAAIAEFDKAIEADPRMYEAYFDRGQTWRVKREYRKAIADFSRAIEIDPNKPVPLCLRGLSKQELGEYESAIEDFTAAVERSAGAENKAFGLTCRGDIHRLKKQYDSALKDYEKAFELDPDYSGSYVGRGLIWKSRKQYQKAIAEITLALEKESYAYKASRELAWLYATCPEDQYRDGKQAVELAKDALRLSNDVAYCSAALAAAYAECGDFDSAVQEQERVLRDLHLTDEGRANAGKMLAEFQAKRPFRDVE